MINPQYSLDKVNKEIILNAQPKLRLESSLIHCHTWNRARMWHSEMKLHPVTVRFITPPSQPKFVLFYNQWIRQPLKKKS